MPAGMVNTGPNRHNPKFEFENEMNLRVMHTARTEIIENGARASRILHFRLGGGNQSEKDHSAPR